MRCAATPPIRLLYAGKLSFAKGVDSLLQAFARMADPHLEVKGTELA